MELFCILIVVGIAWIYLHAKFREPKKAVSLYLSQKQASLLYVNLKIKFKKKEKRRENNDKRLKRQLKKIAIFGLCLDSDLNKPTTRGILDRTKKTLRFIWKYKLNLSFLIMMMAL